MVSLQDLRTAYFEVADNGPVDTYIAAIRDSHQARYSVKLNKLHSLFGSPKMRLWVAEGTASGHFKYKHVITRVIVGFQNHDGNTLDPAGACDLMTLFQEHVNILGNDIFKYTVRNWKSEPNFPRALTSYNQWRAAQSD